MIRQELSPEIVEDRTRPPPQRRTAGILSLAAAGVVLVGAAYWFNNNGSIVAPVTTTTTPQAATTSTTFPTTTLPPDQVRSHIPRTVTNDTVIAALTLSDGTRFMLQLPASRGDDLYLVEPGLSGGPGLIEGRDFGANFIYDYCGGQDAGHINPSGSVIIDRDPHEVTLCRPDQFTMLTFRSDLAFTPEETDQFHLIPVAYGTRFAEALIGEEAVVSQCCFEQFGPNEVSGAILVSNGYQDGRVVALDPQTLVPIWSQDIGDESLLHGVAGAGLEDNVLIVSPDYGKILGLNPTDGAIVWEINFEIDFDDDLFVNRLQAAPNGVWVAALDYRSEGDSRAPELIAFNPDDGEISWSAAGLDGTNWQGTPMIISESAVVIMDVPETAASASLLAFELATGDRLWATSLMSANAWYPPNELMLADHGRDLLLTLTVEGDLLRIDPGTGAVIWRSTTGLGRFVGLGPDVVTLRRGNGEINVNVSDGAFP